MRLLTRVDGVLAFVQRRDETYAILSHTWGKEEVTFEDVRDGRLEAGSEGLRKIDFTLKQAAEDGYAHVWVDTCCIDKKDRNELGEAINLMWKWYQEAPVCYVYLADVPEVGFAKSRWFTRGWTLQELLAPKEVRFFSADGKSLGTKQELRQQIFLACGVDTQVDPLSVSVPERYRWSLSRRTTKEEDASYCLLGLLEVALIFNYGENGDRARERLFKAIEKEHGSRALREIRGKLVTKTTPLSAKDLLATLEFDTMGNRVQTISEQFPMTCEWMLDDDVYKRWMRSETRMIWVKGGPGTGKSTIMKFIESKSAGISFFFNARGELLEQTTLGLYRSLLWQLLKKHPYVQQRIVDRVNKSIEIDRWSVTSQNIQGLLRYAATLLGEPLRCWIDALDECDTKEVQEMIHFFEDCEGLFVCFASRYYPAVVIHSEEILLEHQRHNDLRRYVEGRLCTHDISLKNQLILKANGNFFWAVLVVRLINEDLANGNMFQVQRRLEDLPDELRALLRKIALSANELPRFRHSVHWILFAMEPLHPAQFYQAVVASLCTIGLAPSALPAEPFKKSDEMLSRFVASSSRGLAEITTGDAPRVQFIHESVRDYFLEGGLQELDPNIADPVSAAHEDLKNVCQRWVPYDDPRRYSMEYYANNFIVHHAERAAKSFSQIAFLQEVDTGGETWTNDSLLVRKTRADRLWSALITSDSPTLVRLTHDLGLWDEDNIRSAFMLAVRREDISMVHLLLDLTRDQDLRERYVEDALWQSIDLGTRLLARELIKLRFNLNRLRRRHPDVSYKSSATLPLHYGVAEAADSPFAAVMALPLHEYIARSSEDIAILMIEYGADPEAKDFRGTCALHHASKKSLYRVAKYLIENGADFEARDSKGRTALHHAIENGSVKITEALLEKEADFAARDSAGCTALQYAIRSDSYDVIKMLLEKRADFEAEHSQGRTDLHYAIEKDSYWAVKALLEKRTEFEATDSEGRTDLHYAIKNDSYWAVRAFIENGAEFKAIDSEGCTALHHAINVRSYDIVKLLLKNGADPEAQDSEGRTALLYAIKKGSYDIIELLLKNGADLKARDSEGCTALHHAINTGFNDLIESFFQDLFEDSDLDHDSLRRSKEHMSRHVDDLLDKAADTGVKICSVCDRWRPKVHVYGHGIIKALVKHGADLEAFDDQGHTPLMMCASRCLREEMALLLELGCDANAQNSQGETALHIAVKHAQASSNVQLLLDRGADAFLVTESGYDAWQVACSWAQRAITEHMDRELDMVVEGE